MYCKLLRVYTRIYTYKTGIHRKVVFIWVISRSQYAHNLQSVAFNLARVKTPIHLVRLENKKKRKMDIWPFLLKGKLLSTFSWVIRVWKLATRRWKEITGIWGSLFKNTSCILTVESYRETNFIRQLWTQVEQIQLPIISKQTSNKISK